MAEEAGPWRRIVNWVGVTVAGIAGAWLVTYGAVVATAGHGPKATSEPFWIWPTWLAVAGLVAAAGLVTLGELGLPWRRRRNAGQAAANANLELADRAERLAQEILVWKGDRDRDDPSHRLFNRLTGPGAPGAAHQEFRDAYTRHSTDTMARYNERFMLQTLTVYDDLERAGVPDDQMRSRGRIEHPTNPLGIEDVARTLGTMAAELRRSGGVVRRPAEPALRTNPPPATRQVRIRPQCEVVLVLAEPDGDRHFSRWEVRLDHHQQTADGLRIRVAAGRDADGNVGRIVLCRMSHPEFGMTSLADGEPAGDQVGPSESVERTFFPPLEGCYRVEVWADAALLPTIEPQLLP